MIEPAASDDFAPNPPDKTSVVHDALEHLKAPWCSIIGDHDVHEHSLANFLRAMAREPFFSFTVGNVTFISLNAFDVPHPTSFCVSTEQLEWLKQQIQAAEDAGQQVVLLLHCYPSDLKKGGQELASLVSRPSIRLIDMGHTHYNEVANDGHTLYTATRSTGQIEEGPVGFSVTNIDGEVISWRFFELNSLPAVMITSPADERFITDPKLRGYVSSGNTIMVRTKIWPSEPITRVTAALETESCQLTPIAGSAVWQGEISRRDLPEGIYRLRVVARDTQDRIAEDEIRIVIGASAYRAPSRAPRDQDNPLPPWPERGLLGTQLGPNKNGRKW